MENKNFEKIKEELIAEIERRKEDKIIEPTNAELIEKLINASDNINEAISIAELGTTYKRTGIHFDKRLEKLTNNVKYFEKNTKLSFEGKEDNLKHKLVIGDNYDALLNLLIEYRNKVDIIYIDPPYGKDNMGEFAETNYENAITRDNLLSMLYPRLLLAKQLLSNEGIIFISIDDRNQAYIKCLMDEIWEENCFIACIPRKTGAGNAAANGDAQLRKPFDYLLLYKKSKMSTLTKIAVGEKKYPYTDEHGNYDLKQFQATGSDATRTARPNLFYPIYRSENDKLYLEEQSDTVEVIYPKKIKGEDGRWMWQPKKFKLDAEKYLVYHNGELKRKVYYDETQDQIKYQVEQAWLDNSKYRNSEGTKELNSIMNSEKPIFSNPKPVGLIKWCINLCANSDAIVLDFFAGSGTTGHATLELNREDGGNRQFILCTNNEVTIECPNGIAYDVTSRRLKRIMTGECYDGNKNFKLLKNNFKPYDNSLEVVEIKTVANFEKTEGKTPFDVIDETLYGKDEFDTIREKIEWVCNNFEITEKNIESDDDWKRRMGGK